MTKPSVAYILKTNNNISDTYARQAADSCNSVGLYWEYFVGYDHLPGGEAWSNTGIQNANWNESHIDDVQKREKNQSTINGAACCSAGHAAIWKKVAEGKHDSVVILEHDAVMLHRIEVDVPDNFIVALGYRVANISDYDYKSAGAPTKITNIVCHKGSHAYAITKKTAQSLVKEIENKGILGVIDNAYFLRTRTTDMPIAIMDPTPAAGLVRESTIQSRSVLFNELFIDSFQKHYKVKQ